MDEVFNMINFYGKRIRESLGESRFVHGELYKDAVFGALLSAVTDNALKTAIVEKAFEKYRSENAMCVSLERESVAADAMRTAEEKGIANGICCILGVSQNLLATIEPIVNEYLDKLN